LKSTARLTLGLSDFEARKSLASVLAPDNEGTPRGLRLSMTCEGATIEFLVESVSPSTVVSTVLALLRDISLFQEVWLLSHGKGARVQRA
jgi:hypothetical protein